MSALLALLDGLMDYAGLFPPAALPMDAAVRNYATYRRGAERAMLARFVLPAARLEEFVREASAYRSDGSAWRLSVLAGASDAATVDAFNREHGSRWIVDTIEAKAASPSEVAALASAFADYTVYVEIPVGDSLRELVAEIAATKLRAKIRTGGVTADAFPPPEAVLRFLDECLRANVPFKATAGLHHPLRGEYRLTYAPDAPQGTMYGFLNVFLAATLLHAGHSPSALAGLLEERDASAIVVDESGIAWRGLRADSAQLARARAAFAGSFGSCSFEEPVQDLAALQLLPYRK